MPEKASAKVVPLNDQAAESFNIGQQVYLTTAYYDDHKTSVIAVPKFGWTVTGTVGDVIQIQFHSESMQLFTVLLVDRQYLKHLV